MKTLNKINETELNKILENSRDSMKNILKDDLRRIKLRNFILDKKETKKVDNSYLTINEIKILRKTSKTDREFLLKLEQYINSEKFKESIKKYPQLYEFINLTLSEIKKSKYEIPLLERLKQVVDIKNKEVIIKYIKEHEEKIRLWLEQFKEEKIKHEIAYLLSLINETEIEYLRKKLEELKTLNKDINPFIQNIVFSLKVIGEKQKRYDKRLILELENIKSRDRQLKEKEIEYLNKTIHYIEKWAVQGYSQQYFYDVVRMLEDEIKKMVDTIKHTFRDGELASMIEKSPAVRNLVFYNEMIHYFDEFEYFDHEKKRRLGLLKMVEMGEKEGDWKHFEQVVKNVKKESGFIKKHFGDYVYGERLIQEEAKKHESILDWKADLMQIVRELKSYSNLHKVLENAKLRLKEKINRKLKLLYDELTNEKRELKRILERRLSQLKNENITAIYRLDRTVTKRLGELKNIERYSSRKIMNKLRIETIKINADWYLIRRRYIKIETQFGNYLGDFMDKFIELSIRLDVKENVNNILVYINSSTQYKNYFKRFADNLDLNNVRNATPNITRMMFANAVLDHLDDSIIELTDESFEKVVTSLQGIKELNELKNQLIIFQKNVLDYLKYVEDNYFNKNQVNKIIQKTVKPTKTEIPKGIGG